MAWFEVEVRGNAREVYLVQAESAAEAQENWIDGEPIVQENMESEVYYVTEIDEEN